MGNSIAPRFQPMTVIAYAEILETLDASSVHDVRYVIRTTCCEKTALKSHKSLRTAYQRQWDTCPTCRRRGKYRRAKPVYVPMPAYVLRTPVVKAVKPQTIEKMQSRPVILPEWLCRAYVEWPKPPSVVARVWGQQ